MSLLALSDLVRCEAALLTAFIVAPMLAFYGRPRYWTFDGWAVIFVRTVLFSAVSSLLAGSVRLALPGVIAPVYMAYLLTLAWRAGFVTPIANARWRRSVLARVLTRIDSPRCGSFTRSTSIAPESQWDNSLRALLLLASILSVLASIHALGNWRFFISADYSRALSLQGLSLGQPWQPDGTVSYLAPVAVFSGLDGVTVVRFSACAWPGIAALAAGYLAWRLTHSLSPTLAAAAAASAAFQIAGIEPSLAAAMWLLAIGLWQHSRTDAVWAATTAVLTGGLPQLRLALCVCIALSLIIIYRTGRRAATAVCHSGPALAVVVISLAVLLPARRAAREGPLQDELAARAAWRISRELPRNTWMIVSPVQELAFTYGRGWHMELVDFAGRFQPEQVAHPDFRFQFPSRNVFIFLEKRPLVAPQSVSSLAALGASLDPAVAAYLPALGRQSLQFQVARLLAAYAATHPGVETYAEDSSVVVFRIRE